MYDALGRLKTVKNQSNTVVAEYTYNGLNMRIGWHYDADADADVDANDPWYSFAHDDRWRIVATFRGSDTSPKELFAYHNAGAKGRGSSSYIDSVILRNKDANTSWTSASDATLEERIYYVQNWRADVSAILSSAGVVKEWIKYTSYGIPVRIDPGDYNRDGFVNAADFDDYSDDFDNTRAEADVNFDGYVNGDDYDNDEAIDEVQDALELCECIPLAEQIVAPINVGLDLIQGDCAGAGQRVVCALIPEPGGGGGAPLKAVTPGLIPPGKFSPSLTPGQIKKKLQDKFGPPRSVRPDAETFYNPQTCRSFNVHTDPAHGPPHIDIRKRGNSPDRKYPLRGEEPPANATPQG